VDGVGLREFLASCARLLKRARKPSRREVWLMTRICVIGVVAVGLVGFVIRLLMLSLMGGA